MTRTAERRLWPPLAGILLLGLAVPACRNPQPDAPADARRTAAESTVPQTASAATGPFWPTYHGSPALDGAAEVSLSDSLEPVWRVEVDAGVWNTPVTGEDRVCVADTRGGIHALDWKGREVWSKSFTEPATTGTTPLPLSFDAPLALFDSTLIACAAGGEVYALDVANGSVRWMTDTDRPTLGTPNLSRTVVDGHARSRLFVLDQSAGALQCLDFDSGRLLWVSADVDRCDGSPAVNDAFVAYGSCASAIHVFSTDSKEMLRQIHLADESQVAGGVVLLGDSVFSGSRSGLFIHANVRTGETLWINRDCEGEALSTPAVDRDRVVFTANDGAVYALDRNSGALRWKRKLGSEPSSPVIAGDKVLVSAGGTLYLLRLSDGEPLWSYDVSDEITSPALAGSLVVVGADDGTVTAFGGRSTAFGGGSAG